MFETNLGIRKLEKNTMRLRKLITNNKTCYEKHKKDMLKKISLDRSKQQSFT